MSIVRHIDFEVPDWGEFDTPPQDRPGYRSLVMAAQPLAYWRLGQLTGSTAVDETGAHPGTAGQGVHGGQPGALAWDDDPAAGFDRSSGAVISVPHDPALDNLAGLTVMMWIRWLDFSAAWQLAMITKGPWPQLWGLYLRRDGTDQATLSFAVNNQVLQPVVGVDDRWHLLAGTWDGQVMAVFFDGQLLQSAAESSAMSSNSQALMMLMASDSGGDPTAWPGLMDEPAVFGHALPADQLQLLYSTGADL